MAGFESKREIKYYLEQAVPVGSSRKGAPLHNSDYHSRTTTEKIGCQVALGAVAGLVPESLILRPVPKVGPLIDKTVCSGGSMGVAFATKLPSFARNLFRKTESVEIDAHFPDGPTGMRYLFTSERNSYTGQLVSNLSRTQKMLGNLGYKAHIDLNKREVVLSQSGEETHRKIIGPEIEDLPLALQSGRIRAIELLNNSMNELFDEVKKGS